MSTSTDPTARATATTAPDNPSGGARPSSTRCTRAHSRTPNGDGIGDLAGITSRLPELARLGADAVWLSPFMTSPQKDAGYDVADYCDVDPLFGTLADFDAMLAKAHELGHAGDRRHRAEPLVRPARVVPGGARGGGRVGGARPVPVPRRAGRARRHPAEQLGVRVRRTGVDPHDQRRRHAPASGTCTCSTRRSPTSTGATRGCASSSSACCGSGSTAASTDSASMSRTA